jgi:hypothetical protein
VADMTVTSTRWQVESVAVPTAGRRSVASAANDAHLASVVGDHFEVEQVFRATSPQRRGAEALAPMDITIPIESGALYLLAIRHEASGALSFHAPKPAAPRRVGEAAPTTATFEVEFAEDPHEATRRSILSKVIKGVILKAAGKLADIAVPWIGSEVEDWIWKKRNLRTGWLQVTSATLASGNLETADFSSLGNPSDRCLLLLHGTFSHTAGAFHGLVTTRTPGGQDFFEAVRPLYGNRIYAFNHFTVSKRPEENARELIAGLPRQATFDAITHSRGGLVLRNLLERSNLLGPNAGNFHLGKAVLVAAPNQGTPLATADRFDKLIGWWANLLELFPENPFTTTAEYLGAALNFMARHVVDALPGLDSMNMSGSQISALNAPPGPPPGPYSALISNYQPTSNVLARILDLGMDGIFGMANDLVVPSEGAWKTDERNTWVPATQIGCFGKNLSSPAAPNGVIHTTYFSQPETTDFLVKTLLGQPLAIAPVDPDIRLPFFLRRSLSSAAALATGVPAVAPSPLPTASQSPAFLPAPLGEADDVLHLFLISSDDHLPAGVVKRAARTAILLATYRNARVVETIVLRHDPKKSKGAGVRDDGSEDYHWNKIIGINERIKDYVDGKAGVTLPNADELHELGVNLFNATFPGAVRRLYDVARVDRARAGQRLDIVITSMINWVADKPWEFAYDPSRQSFLATEAVNFTRNVLTAVPAEEPVSHPARPLRILVVVAQPIGLGLLSAEEEERVVRRGFQALEDAGLATLEFMLRARIDELHERLRNPDIDILHFVGHGEYREDEREGYLLFENSDGGRQSVSAESLRQVLCQRGIRLVFLNACETGMVGRGESRLDFNRGVAPKLVSGGIPILVANQYKVLDVSATEFAKHFYWWLALGSTVGDAAREARVAVNYSLAGENIDWAVPVVYARNPGRMIYTEEEKERVQETLRPVSPKAELSPCRAFNGIRIGLWDVNHMLPELDDFATVLNARQTEFCFLVVEVSAPLGTWRRTTGAAGGEPKGYIDGNEAANRLRMHVSRLGVNRLICITAFALADKDDKGLALWNEDASQRVSIVSGEPVFAQMGPAHTDLNRFLANMVVAALCGDVGHKVPPTTCPNYYSDKVDTDAKARLAYLTAPLKFCDECIGKVGSKLEALNGILSAW